MNLQIMVADQSQLKILAEKCCVQVEAGGEDVPRRYLDSDYLYNNLLCGDYVSKEKSGMWLVPFQGTQYSIRIDLGQQHTLLGLKMWNYNSSVEGTYRGVKRVLVTLDANRLSPAEGHLLRKAPGPTSFDFGQRIRLKVFRCSVFSSFFF